MVEIADISTEDSLEKEGWEKRSILQEPRLSEVVNMYKELGLEVLVKELDVKQIQSSNTCLECNEGTLKVVYTRPKKEKGGRNDLF